MGGRSTAQAGPHSPTFSQSRSSQRPPEYRTSPTRSQPPPPPTPRASTGGGEWTPARRRPRVRRSSYSSDDEDLLLNGFLSPNPYGPLSQEPTQEHSQQSLPTHQRTRTKPPRPHKPAKRPRLSHASVSASPTSCNQRPQEPSKNARFRALGGGGRTSQGRPSLTSPLSSSSPTPQRPASNKTSRDAPSKSVRRQTDTQRTNSPRERQSARPRSSQPPDKQQHRPTSGSLRSPTAAQERASHRIQSSAQSRRSHQGEEEQPAPFVLVKGARRWLKRRTVLRDLRDCFLVPIPQDAREYRGPSGEVLLHLPSASTAKSLVQAQDRWLSVSRRLSFQLYDPSSPDLPDRTRRAWIREMRYVQGTYHLFSNV